MAEVSSAPTPRKSVWKLWLLIVGGILLFAMPIAVGAYGSDEIVETMQTWANGLQWLVLLLGCALWLLQKLLRPGQR